MKKQVYLTGKILLVMMVVLMVAASPALMQEDAPATLRNPLNPNNGADPWLTYYDGNYYLAATTWTSILTMRKAPTLAGLKTAEPVQIYYETEPSRCCNMWAPEFHLLDGPNGFRWYFYYTAGTAGDTVNQHMHVLESAGTDPLGPYTYKGRLFDPQNDVWSIDHSVLELDGALYLLYSAWVGNEQSLFIAEMSNPWTMSGGRHKIARPQYDWERIGLNVNEGPVVLQHEGQTFIIYSASFCGTPDYKLGLLTYNGGDPLNASSWDKHPEPVFQQSDENGVYGPGHNGFFTSPDGTENWIVYHANDAATDGCDNGRTTRAQRFTWNEDGTPNFGIPVSTDTEIAAPSGDTGADPLPEVTLPPITRLRAFGLDGAYLSHADFTANIGFDAASPNAQFTLKPGLSDAEAVTLESVNYPGYFLIHRNNVIVLSPDDGSDGFDASATWWVREGLADPAWISLEAYDQPGSFLGKRFGVMALVAPTTDREREDATFFEES